MLEIGTRVTISWPPHKGAIYDYVPSRRWPYHVRPNGWREDRLGIACTEEELEPIVAQEVPEVAPS